MPKILAIATNMKGAHLRGGNPVKYLVETADITDDIPVDVVGEVMTRVIHRAWKAGYDPTTIQFKVRFEK